MPEILADAALPMEKIGAFLRARERRTLLCIGPMSRICIEAAAAIADRFSFPAILIASRRQVDAAAQGGGYVEGFDTETFANYVRSLESPNLFLARDHGGPWQGRRELEEELPVEEAMLSAKQSFEEDIDAGFDFLHLDPSVPIRGEDLTLETILDRLFDLYAHCDDYARKRGREIRFELGTEEQDGYGQDLERFQYFLDRTASFCETERVTPPSFVVAQTYTKVIETRNIGGFADEAGEKAGRYCAHVRELVRICEERGVLLKEHNADYLSNEALAFRPLLGVHASNVAPEFGVAETRALLYLLAQEGLKKERDSFIDCAVSSGKWKKWMLPETGADDLHRAVIAGHYVFDTPVVRDIKARLKTSLAKRAIDLDDVLRTCVRQSIMRYVLAYNLA